MRTVHNNRWTHYHDTMELALLSGWRNLAKLRQVRGVDPQQLVEQRRGAVGTGAEWVGNQRFERQATVASHRRFSRQQLVGLDSLNDAFGQSWAAAAAGSGCTPSRSTRQGSSATQSAGQPGTAPLWRVLTIWTSPVPVCSATNQLCGGCRSRMRHHAFVARAAATTSAGSAYFSTSAASISMTSSARERCGGGLLGNRGLSTPESNAGSSSALRALARPDTAAPPGCFWHAVHRRNCRAPAATRPRPRPTRQ